MTIPFLHILVPYGPINTVIKSFGTFKFIITPSLGLSCPKERLSPHLVASNPIKRLLLNIVLFAAVQIKMRGRFAKCIMLAHNRVCLHRSEGLRIAVFKFPKIHVGRGVIPHMSYHTTTLDYKGF